MKTNNSSASISLNNIMLLTDSYKVTHYRQYPPDTTRVYSYFESRGGRYPEVLFFGLQYILKEYLCGQVVTEEKIQEAREVFALHFGDDTLFNEAGWRSILDKHNGYLPIEIHAVREGSHIPVSQVLVTVVNTDPVMVPWLTNYLETILVQLWYPTTVATQSYFMKQTILRYLEDTGDPEQIAFKLHDFGFRGSTSVESAALGGAAHLVNFRGTDTVAALQLLRNYYAEQMAGFSIPAAEHSTITSWGKSNEVEAYRNMLKQYPSGLVAVVSDSYNIYEACDALWGIALHDEVVTRDGALVIRPDSGDPHEVLPRVLDILGDRFGYTVNAKGYKVLHPKVRLIQGDGIDYITVGTILETLKGAGWSADNISFGSGGGLLQKVDRDTQKFAFKCSAIEINGVWHDDIQKDPVTDHGKKSKAGRLALVNEGGAYTTIPLLALEGRTNCLLLVYQNGILMREQTLADIRQLADYK